MVHYCQGGYYTIRLIADFLFGSPWWSIKNAFFQNHSLLWLGNLSSTLISCNSLDYMVLLVYHAINNQSMSFLSIYSGLINSFANFFHY